jgi:aspartyl aminopeptidase
VGKVKELKEQLFFKSDHIQKSIGQEAWEEASRFAEGYKTFLSSCKTERECVEYVRAEVKKNGFCEFDFGKENVGYKPGDRFYYINRNKAIVIGTVGQKGLEDGLSILVSHIDSPRIDLKPRPVYEKSELCYFKTHYYGGIKKYQWTALPLAIHGKVIKKNGEELMLKIGELEDEPLFCITDLLPHLADEQMKRPFSKGVMGEELNLLVGSLPYCVDPSEANDSVDLVKLNIFKILNDKYGLVEQDMVTAEISLVPVFKARDVGFDRSLIGAYGQDDRVCAYASLMSHLRLDIPTYTVLTVFADKEETGSEGNTGLDSFFFGSFVEDLASKMGANCRRVLANSCCLSADVNAAFDPSWPDAFEKSNTAMLNHGAVITKYTGSRGKSGTSDAAAEFVHRVTTILDENNVGWQPGMLGKVDTGGGGTVAKYIARLNVDVIDVGVPLLSMHSPYEITSKWDVYMLNRAFEAFLKRSR